MGKRFSRNGGSRIVRPFDRSRRQFLAGVTGMAATSAWALAGCSANQGGTSTGGGTTTTPQADALPNPGDSGIEHIVHVQMENRSFDHLLGWVPGADSLRNRTFLHTDGSEVSTFHLAADSSYGYQGCGWEDPDHSYGGGRTHMNNGAMDGFLKTVSSTGDKFPAGYYEADDVLFYKGVAENFTVCDRYFHGILSSTFPNRIYMHAGATDRNSNGFAPAGASAPASPSLLPTIWDQLKAKGISCKSYFSDLPIPALWGATHLDITQPFESFLADVQANTLPAVSYFDPYFGFSVGESPAGVSRDDHPQADIRDGQVYLTQIYNALRSNPDIWAKTLMVVTYDEWGGFFEHVVPPVSPVSAAETALGNDGRLGFRVPCVLLGPRARRGYVSHLQLDPNSLINMIRWRFGLNAIGDSPRNQTSMNMAYALDFQSAPNLDAPDFGDLGPGGTGNSRAPGYGMPCTQAAGLPGVPNPIADAAARSRAEHLAELQPLYDMAKKYGFI